MCEIKREKFIKKVVEAINENNLFCFIGAGMSCDSGLPSWDELIKEISNEAEIEHSEFEEIKKDFNLIEIAQFIINKNINSRQEVYSKLKKQLSVVPPKIGKNLLEVAKLPISEFWTTNYDTLIEEAINKNFNYKPNVVFDSKHFVNTNNNNKFVYKMHGHIDDIDSVVISRQDYTKYKDNRLIFWNKLELELTYKTCIFLGTGMNDYNLNHILANVDKFVKKENQISHYLIMKEQDGEIQKKIQKYRMDDLHKNFNIRTLLIKDFSEIESIFKEINQKLEKKNVFISGATDEENSECTSNLVAELSLKLIESGYKIFNGYGKGVGDSVLRGAMSKILEEPKELNEKLEILPFPQYIDDTEKRNEIWTKNREYMISNSSCIIIVCGNKKEGDQLIISEGVMEEFEIAKKLEKKIIPIPTTKYAAKKIFEIIKDDISNFKYLKKYLKKLEQLNDIYELIGIINEITKN